MAEYENLSKKTLLDAVKSETSGDYRQALLAVCEWRGGEESGLCTDLMDSDCSYDQKKHFLFIID